MTRALIFAAPRRLHLEDEPTPAPQDGQALVRTRVSGISAGTELLIYRGQAPDDLPADATLPSLSGRLEFPLQYGYSAVGEITSVGPKADPHLVGRSAFAFQPHKSHFVSPIDDLLLLPEDQPGEQAVLLPNMETAVGLVHDGRPLAGEQVVVFGLGVVGLLTTALLGRMPLHRLITLDRHLVRRQASLDLGADLSLDPSDPDSGRRLQEQLGEVGADLCFEVTGDPHALDQAIAAAGFEGRVVIGSWYGRKRAEHDLGGRFHRSRITLIGSQVSTIASGLTGRWTRRRRLLLALDYLHRLPVGRLITHRYPFEEAATAYRWLDQEPGEAIQVVLTYGGTGD